MFLQKMLDQMITSFFIGNCRTDTAGYIPNGYIVKCHNDLKCLRKNLNDQKGGVSSDASPIRVRRGEKAWI
jgi:hypothetical protein